MSTTGSTNLARKFDLDRHIDAAAQDVRTGISKARANPVRMVRYARRSAWSGWIAAAKIAIVRAVFNRIVLGIISLFRNVVAAAMTGFRKISGGRCVEWPAITHVDRRGAHDLAGVV